MSIQISGAASRDMMSLSNKCVKTDVRRLDEYNKTLIMKLWILRPIVLFFYFVNNYSLITKVILCD